MQVLTYKYRLLPTSSQHKALLAVLDSQRALYNAALEERIDCYRKTGQSVSYIDQCKSLTECRRGLPEMAALPLNIQRGTLRRLDEAYKAFFRRVKSRDGRAGFPRFRGKGWFNSFDFNEMDGLRFDGKRFRFKGVPSGIRAHQHRPRLMARSLPQNSSAITRAGRCASRFASRRRESALLNPQSALMLA